MQIARDSEAFQPRSVDTLCTVARRYLLGAIAPGTPLADSVRITMSGSMVLGGGRHSRMRARQLLAPPAGLVWRGRIAYGCVRIDVVDRFANSAAELRRSVFGVLPLLAATGAAVTRSTAARVAIESILFPPALLPWRGAAWESLDDGRARVRVVVGGLPVFITIEFDDAGRVRRASVMRWRERSRDEQAGYVRFAIDRIAEERTFRGYTIPTRFRAGWRLGEAGEEPVVYARIRTARFR